VRRREGQRRVQVGLQQRHGLAGQCVHQVDVEAVEGIGRLGHRGARLGRVVHAADGAQAVVVKALHADRQARHAGSAEGAEALALEGAGVGFERDLDARHQRQQRTHIGQQPLDAVGREQAGRAAADEHAGHRPAPHQRQRGFEIGAQCIQVALLLRRDQLSGAGPPQAGRSPSGG
jgi:hypothetical protein